ncbi:MAG: ATP synthase F0 subunit B [Patescibacteria group bacterium]
MDIQFPQILFQAINFLVVVGSLSVLLYKPILKVFDERSKRIAEGQKAAEEALVQREQIEVLGEKTKQELNEKSAQILDKATKEASTTKTQIIEEAKQQAQVEVELLKQKWVNEKEQMLKGMNDQLAEAVIQTSAKVVGTSLTSAQHSKLIDQELNLFLKQI